MIYLSFTSTIPDRPFRGAGTEHFGKIIIHLGGKAYQMIETDNSRALQGEPRPQYLIQDRDTLKVPIHVLILEKKADSEDIRTGTKPFYLPFQETSLDTLKSIYISVTVLEEYETSVFVVGSGRQTACRPCDIISETVENALPPLPGGYNGYEIRLNIVNSKIRLDFLPKRVLLDKPVLSLTATEQNVSEVIAAVDRIVTDSVAGLDKKSSQINIQSQLEIAVRSLEMALEADVSLRQHRIFSFNLLNQKFNNKINEIQPSSIPLTTSLAKLNSFLIPDFDADKEALIMSLNGTARHFKNDTFQIVIDSTLLKKEIRQTLGIDRFKFKLANQVISRLQFLTIYCDATSEHQPDGAYLVTFPAHRLELVKKVAYEWEDVCEKQQTESGRRTLFCK